MHMYVILQSVTDSVEASNLMNGMSQEAMNLGCEAHIRLFSIGMLDFRVYFQQSHSLQPAAHHSSSKILKPGNQVLFKCPCTESISVL
jgi:hypothetical protein